MLNSIFMKKNLFIILSLFIYSSIYSQIPVPAYYYDDAGNRIQRKIIFINPNSPRIFDDSISNNDDNITKFGINAFPNPTSDAVNVSISSLKSGDKVTVILYDELGKELAKKQQSNKLETIDIKNFNAGTYYLKIVKDKDYIYFKMLKF